MYDHMLPEVHSEGGCLHAATAPPIRTNGCVRAGKVHQSLVTQIHYMCVYLSVYYVCVCVHSYTLYV